MTPLTCSSGKLAFPSKVQAQRHKRVRKQRGVKLEPYQCHLCGACHLSRKGAATIAQIRREAGHG